MRNMKQLARKVACAATAVVLAVGLCPTGAFAFGGGVFTEDVLNDVADKGDAPSYIENKTEAGAQNESAGLVASVGMQAQAAMSAQAETVHTTVYWGYDSETKTLYLGGSNDDSRLTSSLSNTGTNFWNTITIKQEYKAIEHVVVVNTLRPSTIEQWFFTLKSCADFDLDKMDFSQCVNYANAFHETAITKANIAHIVPMGKVGSSTRNLHQIFTSCYNLTTLYAPLDYSISDSWAYNLESVFAGDPLVGGEGTKLADLGGNSPVLLLHVDGVSLSGSSDTRGLFTEGTRIRYKSNGGGQDDFVLDLVPDSDVTIFSDADCGFTNGAASFTGWNTKADGSGTDYSPNDTFHVDESGLTLYAQWHIPTYDVTYDVNGGDSDTAPAAQTKVAGTNLTLHAGIPSRDPDETTITTTLDANEGAVSPATLTTTKTAAWTFDKWTTEQNGSGTAYNPGATYSEDADLQLYAQWTQDDPQYTSAALPTPTRDGYTFKGWYDAATGDTKVGDGGATYTPTADGTLHAQWDLIQYDVTYGKNTNADDVTSMPNPLAVKKDWNVNLATPTQAPERTPSSESITVTYNLKGGTKATGAVDSEAKSVTVNYAFAGWNTAADGSGGSNIAAGGSYTANEDATLYAQWTPTRVGQSVTLPAAPTMDNHNFLGWTDDPAASDNQVKKWDAGATITVDKDTVIYAVWDPAVYAVDYDGNAGGNTVSSLPTQQTGAWGTQLVLSSNEPTREKKTGSYVVSYEENGGTECSDGSAAVETEYTFTKWNTQADGRGDDHARSENWTVSGDMTLYAQWNESVTVKPVTLPAPTRTGYSFQGWTVASDGTGEKLTGSFTPSGDVTLYAQWKPDEYVVTYDVNGGDEASKPAAQVKLHGTDLQLSETAPTWGDTTGTVSVTYDGNGGSAVNPPANPGYTTKHTFLKWRGDDSKDYAPGATYTANAVLKLTAQWDSKTSYGSVKLPDAEREGYDFLGWYTATSGGTKVGDAGDSLTPSGTAGIELHAQWSKKKYTVAYHGNTDDASLADMPSPLTGEKEHDAAFTLSGTTPKRNDTTESVTVTFDYRGGAGTPISSPSTVTTKHTFKEWNTQDDGEGTTYASSIPASVNQNVDLFAIWDEPVSGTAVDLPTPTTMPSNEHQFKGWTTDECKSTPYDRIPSGKLLSGTYAPTADITLYAVYTPPVYDVTYDANGGQNAPAAQLKQWNVELTLQSGWPTRDADDAGCQVTYDANGGTADRASDSVTGTKSYAFTVWNTAADGSGDAYKPGPDGKHDANSNLDLYAQWESTLNITPSSVMLPNAGWLGHTFLGWYDESGKRVGGAGEAFDIPEGGAALHAEWDDYEDSDEPFNYTVKFLPGDGAAAVANDSQAFTFGVPQALDAGALTAPSGKVFSHWLMDDGVTTFNEHQLVSNLTNQKDGVVTLTAVWKEVTNPVTYKVEYYEQGTDGATYGSPKSADTITDEKGATVAVPASAQQAPLGFHFDSGSSHLSDAVDENGSTTLTVYWARNQFDVEFDKGADDATGTMAGQHFVWASGVTLTPNAFARTGWKFTGWKVTEQNGMTAQGEGFMSVQSDDAAAMAAQALGDLVADRADGSKLSWVDGDTVVLTAQWEKDTSGGNGDDDDHGGNKPGGGDDDDDNPGGDKPGGGDDDDDNRGGDKPGGGGGEGGGSGSDADNGSGSGAERAGFTREAAGSGANGKAPGTGDPMMAVLQCLGAMALLAALALVLSLRQSRRSARVVGTWSMPAQRAASKHPTPRKVDRGRHARR